MFYFYCSITSFILFIRWLLLLWRFLVRFFRGNRCLIIKFNMENLNFFFIIIILILIFVNIYVVCLLCYNLWLNSECWFWSDIDIASSNNRNVYTILVFLTIGCSLWKLVREWIEITALTHVKYSIVLLKDVNVKIVVIESVESKI